MTTVGTKPYTFERVQDWCKVPPDMTIGSVSGVAVDSRGRVFTCQQRHVDGRVWKRQDPREDRLADPPVIVFDQKGNYLNSWGTGIIAAPHTIYIGQDDLIYIADRGDHVALKLTLDGETLLETGTRGQASDTGCTVPTGPVLRAAGPFNEPLRMIPSPSGDLYVADGYCNSRIHRFAPDGRLISSWGTPGDSAPGEFRVPHSIFADKEGLLYVTDRNNNRIQVFSADGELVDQWTDVEFPTDIFIDANDTIYLLERPSRDAPEHYVSIRDRKGNVLARWKTPPNHQVWVDSQGDIYVTVFGDQMPDRYVRQP
jgi:DNA-binding beta-propeller fold protein YncE